MPPNYAVAREYLEQAARILEGSESRTRQLRYIIERTIVLMEETRPEAPLDMVDNVLSIASFRGRCSPDQG